MLFFLLSKERNCLSRSFSLSAGSTRTTVVTTSTTDISLGSNGLSDLNTRKVFKVDSLQEFLGLGINFDARSVQSRSFGNVVVTTFTFFFLQLEGDTTDGTTRDTLHQVGGETSNLVTKTLGLNNGDFIEDSLVDLEVESETRVVLFNDDTRSLLDSLGSILKTSVNVPLLILIEFPLFFYNLYLPQHIHIHSSITGLYIYLTRPYKSFIH